MAKKKSMRGGELMVFVNDTCYPLATQCSFTASESLLDPQTKDDSIYGEPDDDSKQWSISGTNQSDDAFATFCTLYKLAKAKEPVTVKLGRPANASKNGVPDSGWTLPTTSINGKVYVQNVSFSAPKEGKATLSFNLSGCSDIA